MQELHLKKLRLKNFCNYEDYTFDFTKPDGSPYPFVCFFGPNGVGKSTLLEAISLLTMNQSGRPMSYIQESLKKFIRNMDYNPSTQALLGKTYDKEGYISGGEVELPDMLIEGTYGLNQKEYVVIINQHGWIRNDFAPIPPSGCEPEEASEIMNNGPWGDDHLKYRQRVAHFVSSDSDLSLNKFQLHGSYAKEFEEIIATIMMFPTECVRPPSVMTDLDHEFCTDLVIVKKDHRIHFKRMSAGEKKICKSFSSILNLMHALENPRSGEVKMGGWPRLLLIDNCVMHVYYNRHVTMVDKLKHVFKGKQIFATTHSGILIQRFLDDQNDQFEELYINLEEING